MCPVRVGPGARAQFGASRGSDAWDGSLIVPGAGEARRAGAIRRKQWVDCAGRLARAGQHTTGRSRAARSGDHAPQRARAPGLARATTGCAMRREPRSSPTSTGCAMRREPRSSPTSTGCAIRRSSGFSPPCHSPCLAAVRAPRGGWGGSGLAMGPGSAQGAARARGPRGPSTGGAAARRSCVDRLRPRRVPVGPHACGPRARAAP